jgi:ankyrin repeat protein
VSDLFKKIMNNDMNAVKEMISSGADINQKDQIYGYTPLLWACELNYTEMAKFCIAKGADITLRGENRATALILAAKNSQELVELLLSEGADINARSKNGTGAMTNCVMGILSGRVPIELAELLLSRGAEIDEKNTSEYYEGYTPLFWAADENHEELVRFLIDNGANVNARAANGSTPLSIAAEAGHETMMDILNSNGAQ